MMALDLRLEATHKGHQVRGKVLVLNHSHEAGRVATECHHADEKPNLQWREPGRCVLEGSLNFLGGSKVGAPAFGLKECP